MSDTDAGITQTTPDGLVMETLLVPEGRADPYPRYRKLRELAPVHRSELGPVWFLTRWADCNFVLRDHRFGKGDMTSGRQLLFNPELPPREQSFMGDSMLFVNPPDHTRLRALVSRGFTPKRVQQLEAHIGRMADVIVDQMARASEVEVMDTLAFRLPVQVIGELVGVPPADRDQFRNSVRDAAAALRNEPEGDVAAQIAAELDDRVELIASRVAELPSLLASPGTQGWQI